MTVMSGFQKHISDLWLIDLIKYQTDNSPFLKPNYNENTFRFAFKYDADCSS